MAAAAFSFGRSPGVTWLVVLADFRCGTRMSCVYSAVRMSLVLAHAARPC